jgi:hypothetical protein
MECAYYFVDGTWNVPTYYFVDGTWNVPTTLTFVGRDGPTEQTE